MADSNLVASSSLLEDDVQYVFKWPGHLLNLKDDMKSNIDLFDITTNNFEKYKCAIPVDQNNQAKSDSNNLTGENQILTSSLFESIYAKKLCSYRIESYWIYELCHGQYVKQYHETKNAGKRVVNEEYFLGYFKADKQEPDYLKENDQLVPNIHWRNVDGQRVATYAVRYTDGTPCDVLLNVPREITIFYACDENGNDNIATFEEVSSCVYEMVVVSKWICSHPAYRTPEKNKKTISCYSVENSPTHPEELKRIEQEKLESLENENRLKMTDSKGETFIIHYRTMNEEETDNLNQQNQQQQQIQQQQQPQDEQNDQMLFNNINHNQKNLDEKLNQHYQSINDAEKQMITEFLAGEQCLSGGQGWWKYEICLGKQVMQYHEDEQTKKRNNVLLGAWNVGNHLEWLEKHPSKKPLANKSERSTLSLLYSDGDLCENKKRFVEVKLRCLKPSEKSHAISLYLIEPVTCEYLLAVESYWLCDYIEKYDINNN